ncbi:hypothetical protein Hamer_G015806 [Homarus americanus]|uniref:Uncharacterized protein n=1 Tax=Homarus americanus TaxID=6706 RepID=A0A8J5N7J1_HOMAM|nr:hypothetical protein Hamer_G015806 [Homarus americanus]
MMVPEAQKTTDAECRNTKMMRTNSETSNLRSSREKIGVRGRSKSLSVRFADTVTNGSGRNKPSCSMLVPPHHRVSTVYVEKNQHCPQVMEEPMEVMEETPQTTSEFNSTGSGRGWFRGRKGSPPPTHILSSGFHHSSLELTSPEESVDRRESRVRMLLKGVGSFFRYSKRKFRISSVSCF